MPKKPMTDAEKKAWGAKPPLRSTAYRAIHTWVETQRGKPYSCEDCKKDSLRPNQYHWANISGLYKRSTDDWKRLCAKCHKKFDGFGLSSGFCKRGHSIAAVGTYTRPSGYTQCRKCKNMSKHRKITNERVLA